MNELNKKLRARSIFGKLKGWKRPTAEIMQIIDRELDSKIMTL